MTVVSPLWHASDYLRYPNEDRVLCSPATSAPALGRAQRHSSKFAAWWGRPRFLGYTLALWRVSIWYRRAWSMTLKSALDGVVYALVTTAVGAWLWPH